MIRASLFLGAVFLVLAMSRAAPVTYDQRQDGDGNLHAKLENLLFVLVFPSNLPIAVTQALIQRSNALPSSSSSSSEDYRSDSTSFTARKSASEEASNETENYSSKIIWLDGDDSSRKNSLRVAETETSGSSDQHTPAVSIGESVQAEKADDVARMPKTVRVLVSSKDLEKLAISRHLDTRKSHKTRDSDQAPNMDARNSDVERQKPVVLSKKQPLRKGDAVAADNVAPSSSSALKNAVATLPDEKRQELKLLGDGIENCGPGRRRDAVGVCQFDESAASLL